jgi:hypothetical protein
MDESSIPMSHIVLPVTLVNRPVLPLLHSPPISLIILPLSLVYVLLLELNWTQGLTVSHLEISFLVKKSTELLFLLLDEIV